MRSASGTCAVLLAGTLALVGVACSSSDDPVAALPLSVAEIAGEWEIRLTETSDTCGFLGPAGPISEVWRIEDQDGEPIVTVDLGGVCRTRAYTLDANALTRESTGLFLDFQGSDCRARLEIRETLLFDDGSFVGESRATYSYESGSCQRPYPCEQVFEIMGSPCDACSIGC